MHKPERFLADRESNTNAARTTVHHFPALCCKFEWREARGRLWDRFNEVNEATKGRIG